MKKIQLTSCLVGIFLSCSLALSPAHALSDPSQDLLARIFQDVNGQPAPQPAACGWYCESIISYTTGTVTGSGADCTAAQVNLTSQLQAIAHNTCLNNTGMTYCNLQVFTTVACSQVSPGVWQVQGYATHRCRETTC